MASPRAADVEDRWRAGSPAALPHWPRPFLGQGPQGARAHSSPDSAAGSRPRVHPALVGRLRLSCVGHWRNSSLKRQSTWSLLGTITPTRELARFTRQSRCPGHLPPSLRRQPDMNIFAQGDCKQAGTAPVYFVVGMAGFIPSPIVLPARKEFSFVDRSRPMSFCLCSAQTSTAVTQSAAPFRGTACITALFGSKPTARLYPSPTFAMRIPRNQPISSGLRKCKKEEKNKI